MMLDPKIPAKIAGLEKTYSDLRFRAVEALRMEMVEMYSLNTLPGSRDPSRTPTLAGIHSRFWSKRVINAIGVP